MAVSGVATLARPRRRSWRWAASVVVLLAVVAVGGWGLQQVPDLHALASYVLPLETWAVAHEAVAVSGLAAAIFVSAAAALPFGGTITAIGGFLLGWFVAGATAVLVAPLGALLLFCVVRRTFGERWRSRLAARFQSLLHGFHSDAASYLICLRLMPTPFWLVNISAAVLGVRTLTFWWTTAIGIVPMTFAHALAGAAIGDVVRAHRTASEACAGEDPVGCSARLGFADMITPSTVLAFAALGLLSLTPVLVRRLRLRQG